MAFIRQLPFIILLMAVPASSLLWAGFEPIGMDVIHVMVWVAFSLFIAVEPHCIPGGGFARVLLPWGILAAWFAVGWYTGDRTDAGRDVVLFCIDAILASWIVAGSPRKRIFNRFGLVFITGAILACHHILLIIRTPENTRIPGMLAHGYHFGFLAVVLFFPAIGIGLSGSRRSIRLTALASAAVFLSYLLVDVKTLPMLVYGPGVLIMAYYFFRDQTKKDLFPRIAAAGCATLILSWLLLPQWMLRDIQTFWMHHIRDSLTYHLPPMETAWHAGWTRPLMGFGPGTFPGISAMFQPPGVDSHIYHAHSGFLELFAEAGIIGVVCVIWGMVILFRYLFQSLKRRAVPASATAGAIISLGAAIVMGMFDFGLQTPSNLLGIVILISLYPAAFEHRFGRVRLAFIRVTCAGIIGLLCGIYIPHVTGSVSLARARLARDAGRLATAAEYIDTALIHSTDERILEMGADVYLMLATLRGTDSDIDKAVEMVDRVLIENPRQGRFYAARAALRRIADDTDPRIGDDLRRAYELVPSNNAVRIGYMEYLALTGDTDGFRSFLDTEIGAVPPVQIAEFSRALADLSLNDRFLLEILDDYAAKMPPVMITDLADHMRRQKRVDDLNRLLEALPDGYFHRCDLETLLQLVDMTHGMGLTMTRDRCMQNLSHATGSMTDAQRAKLDRISGDIARSEGDLKTARDHYAAAIRYAPEDLWLHKSMADVIRMMDGDSAEIQYWLAAKTYLPASYRVYLALGSAYERFGRLDLALANYRQAEAMESGAASRQILRLRELLGVSHLSQPTD